MTLNERPPSRLKRRSAGSRYGSSTELNMANNNNEEEHESDDDDDDVDEDKASEERKRAWIEEIQNNEAQKTGRTSTMEVQVVTRSKS